MRNEKLAAGPLNWDDLPEEEPRPGLRRKAYATDEVMIVWNEVSEDLELSPHSHDDFDQLAWITEGRCRFHVEDEVHELRAGSMLLVPAGKEHYLEPLEGSCINVDIFLPPRADYLHMVSYLEAVSP